MSRIVMKFGGTSVGSVDRIKNVSNIVQSVYDEGHELLLFYLLWQEKQTA